MKLTDRNYYSLKANKEYASYSQFKTFIDCQSRMYAEYITGEYVRPESEALLVGQLFETIITGTPVELKDFILLHSFSLISLFVGIFLFSIQKFIIIHILLIL